MRIGAYVMFCEPDLRWLDGFLENAEMMEIPIAWHLDHCSEATKEKIKKHPLTVGVYEEDNERFLESFRRRPFKILKDQGFDWMFHWDIDERWDVSAKEKFYEDVKNAEGYDTVRFPMFTAWEDNGEVKLRIDTIFSPGNNGTQTNRMRMYNGKNEWKWLDRITVGPTLFKNDKISETWTEYHGTAPIIHYGCYTKELREAHRKRWDDNYTHAIGRNPYGFWEYINDPTIKVKLANFEDYGLTRPEGRL